jgi:ketosteroid isomerase-like protein
MFQAVDAGDADAFVSYLTEDAVFRYGSQEAVRGRAAIRAHVAGFFETVRGLRHRVTDSWAGEGSVVCEGEVTYSGHDGSEVTLPFVNVLRLEGEQIREYLVYVDPTPLAGLT